MSLSISAYNHNTALADGKAITLSHQTANNGC